MRKLVAVLMLIGVTAACSHATNNATNSATNSATSKTGAKSSTATNSTTAAPTSAASSAAVQTTKTAGPCPYLDQNFVQDTVGQHVTQGIYVYTTTPPQGPLPRCDFIRASGEAITSVTTTYESSPAAAQAAAIAIAPSGNPVTGIGDGGVVLVESHNTVLGVSKGKVLVSVTINQQSSLEAKEIATQVMTAL